MKNLTESYNEQKQNIDLLKKALNGGHLLNRSKVIEFCKRAKIKVYSDLIDDEVKDEFFDYYKMLPLPSRNNGDDMFELS